MSWFQLADLWTEGISAGQYASFLEDVMECIGEVGPDGVLRLRKEGDIRSLATLARETEDAEKVAAASAAELASKSPCTTSSCLCDGDTRHSSAIDRSSLTDCL